MEKFLYIELIVLPDPRKPSELEEKFRHLRERIVNKSSPNFFFKEYYEDFMIPSESLSLYMQSVWNKIINNQNNAGFTLDLSELKLFLINFTFETIKNQVYKEILINFLTKMKKSIADNEFIDLSKSGADVLKEADQLLQKYAVNYPKTAEFAKKKQELTELLIEDLRDIFMRQVQMLKKIARNGLAKLISAEGVSCKKFNLFAFLYFFNG